VGVVLVFFAVDNKLERVDYLDLWDILDLEQLALEAVRRRGRAVLRLMPELGASADVNASGDLQAALDVDKAGLTRLDICFGVVCLDASAFQVGVERRGLEPVGMEVISRFWYVRSRVTSVMNSRRWAIPRSASYAVTDRLADAPAMVSSDVMTSDMPMSIDGCSGSRNALSATAAPYCAGCWVTVTFMEWSTFSTASNRSRPSVGDMISVFSDGNTQASFIDYAV
jgi:hypothetical protein